MRRLIAIARQVGRFGLVGGVATAIHLSVALCLTQMIGLSPHLSHPLGFAVAASFASWAHGTYTFQSATRAGRRRYLMVAGVGYGLSHLVLGAVLGLGMPVAAAQLVTVLTLPPATFLASRYWAYRRAEGCSADPTAQRRLRDHAPEPQPLHR